MKSRESGQDARQLLPAIYQLLAEVLDESGLEGNYPAALRHVFDVDQAAGSSAFLLLPLLACTSAGGSTSYAVPVAAAWRALQLAAQLLDDVEDNDAAPEEQLGTSAAMINLATGLIAVAGTALGRLPPELWFDVQRDFNRAMLHMAAGQDTDLQPPGTLDLDGYIRLMEAKSATAFAAVARAGARCATADPVSLKHYQAFGAAVGLIVQIGDDLAGFRQSSGSGDLALGRRTLPVHYAFAVASPSEQAHLESALKRASFDRAAADEARQIAGRCGAEAYLLAELIRYRRRALAALDALQPPLSAGDALRTWLMAVWTAACQRAT